MTRDQLLAPTKGEPFHAFEVRTTSGETYTVTHREQYWVSPKGETVLVYLSDRIAFIDGDHVSEFVRLVRPPKRRKENS
jgi:hypothetical protein